MTLLVLDARPDRGLPAGVVDNEQAEAEAVRAGCPACRPRWPWRSLLTVGDADRGGDRRAPADRLRSEEAGARGEHKPRPEEQERSSESDDPHRAPSRSRSLRGALAGTRLAARRTRPSPASSACG